MNKYIFSLILSISLITVAFSLSNRVYAFGGRNGECTDAQLTIDSDTDGNAYYKTRVNLNITGICIKAGSDMFGDGHSGVLSNGIYENGCYEVKGVGTNSVTVKRLKNGESCKEVSHIDIYQTNIILDTKPIIIEPLPQEEKKDEVVLEEKIEEKIEDNTIVEETKEIITTEVEEKVTEIKEATVDTDEDEAKEEKEEEKFEELAPEVKAKSAERELAAITELPKTGAGNLIVGLFGFVMSALGYKKKK